MKYVVGHVSIQTQYDSYGVHSGHCFSPSHTKKGKTVVELKYNLYICSKKIGFENIRSSSLNRKITENQSDMVKSDVEEKHLEHDTTICCTLLGIVSNENNLLL